jgi:tripeptide aminopeptidase
MFTSTAAERFLRYVTFDTQSSESSETYPSTDKQLILLNQLVKELKELGIADAAIDKYGYVMATLPASPGKAGVPAIGFIAHVDTSPEVSGTGVRPIVHEHYDGRDLVLPDDPAYVLREADDPELAAQRGHDIITASGLTLLGADDKAGVAEIMAAVEHLMAHPEIPHGPVKIGFTPMKKWAGARSTSTSPASARNTRIRWMAARAGGSRRKIFRPTPSPSPSRDSTSIRDTRRERW